MIQFLSGGFVAIAFAIALFFCRFWRRTGDRLFALLSIAFVLLALERTILTFVPGLIEGREFVYLIRLAAFALIIVGVLDKNWKR
jgi:hypothetical protein